MNVKIKDNILTVEMELSKGERSKSGKSLVMFSTSGFKKVDGTDLQISINVIKSKQ